MQVKRIEKQNLGLAGEYAVASELCKRGYYAQVTLGRQKRTDILAYHSESGMELRLEVKSKQGYIWPGVKGITGPNAFLVLVDFKNKGLDKRPDFYILKPIDWKRYINKYVRPLGRQEVKIDENYCPHYMSHHGKKGHERYVGTGLKPDEISQHKDAWDKLKLT